MLYEQNLTTGFRSCASITDDVRRMISDSRVQEGICVISVPHTTAGLAITSFWDPRGLADLLDEMDRNIPTRVDYKHQDSPYDASGHVKSALMGTSASLIIHNGRPVLGSSQGLVFVEFDGPRPRTFRAEIIAKKLHIERSNLQTRYMGMHNITSQMRGIVERSGVKDGICHISMMHSTAGLMIASPDEIQAEDVMDDIERMIPTRVDFKHRETASDAGGHVKTALTDSQITVPVRNGQLMLGSDQAVIFAEYDGPRPRYVMAAVYSGAGE